MNLYQMMSNCLGRKVVPTVKYYKETNTVVFDTDITKTELSTFDMHSFDKDMKARQLFYTPSFVDDYLRITILPNKSP